MPSEFLGTGIKSVPSELAPNPDALSSQKILVTRSEVELLYEAVKWAYKKAQEDHSISRPACVKEAMHAIVDIVDRAR